MAAFTPHSMNGIWEPLDKISISVTPGSVSTVNSLPAAYLSPYGLEGLVQRIEAVLMALEEAEKCKQGPLFSAASEDYCDELLAAGEENAKEVNYLRHRTSVFIAIVGDKPVTSYTKYDLQTFVNEVCWLPPNISKSSSYDIANVLEYIDENKTKNGIPLARNTLEANYLSRIKTILKSGCESIGVPFALAMARIRIPKSAPGPKQRLLPDHAALTKLFRAGVNSGNFVNALLPLFGFVTGRRLGLLVFLCREDIQRYHDSWIITPREFFLDNGRWKKVPLKTEQSRKYFVLHDIFEEIGLIEYLQKQGSGFIFEELHAATIRNPADTAQKRMKRLYEEADIDRKVYGTFHALRHAKINEDRELAIDSRTTRLQVGHELRDVHENYGGQLRRSEIQAIARAALPKDVDLNSFKALDFEKLAANKITRGRPKNRQLK